MSDDDVRRHHQKASRWENSTPSRQAECAARSQTARSLAGSAHLRPNRFKPAAVAALGTTLEHHERCEGCGHSQEWRHRNEHERAHTLYQCVTIALDSATSAVGSSRFDLRRNGIRVNRSSPHKTSNQYSPSFGSGMAKSIFRLTPFSLPLNSAGHLRIGWIVPSGWFSRSPTSDSPTTSPDFSEMNIVRFTAKVTP